MEVLALFLFAIALTVLVGSIMGFVAMARIRELREALERVLRTLNGLKEELKRLKEKLAEKGPAAPAEKKPEVPAEEPKPEAEPKVPAELRRAKTVLEVRAPAPAEKKVPAPAKAAEKKPKEPVFEKPSAPPAAAPSRPVEGPPVSRRRPEPVGAPQKMKPLIDQEQWRKIEEMVGKNWTTWAGVLAIFLGVGFFVKYAIDHDWLGPTARVVLGVIFGIAMVAAGERFIRRKMRALGQGLVGGGLAILYVSLYAAYGFYDLLPQEAVFGLMALVTAAGVILAVIHDAIPVSFLAVLGGLLTPVLLRTGKDPRDALFAYLFLLNAGVLAVAFFKRWRALDLLAFFGTWGYFTAWYFLFYTKEAALPATLWVLAFYALFLILPFVFHLRGRTPVTGERFFMAVSNAAAAFIYAYAILHGEHKHVLGLLALGMSASYLVLGSLTRKRIKEDARAVFGFLALSVMLLTVAIPIHFDFHGVTVTWAVEAPLLLYLAYKYDYLPVRLGSLIPLVLAAGRIFTVDWPMHAGAFTPVLNVDFGSAIFVALAGAAYTLVHHYHKKSSRATDTLFKIVAAMGSAFLALVVMHVEVWQWLDLSGREHFVRWAATFVWAAGALAFLASGMKLRSTVARLSGFVALLVAGVLMTWDYCLGMRARYFLLLNGRFLAALAATAVVFAYAVVYRRSKETCRPGERASSTFLYGAAIFLLTLLTSLESWQWLTFRGYHYIARCVLPFLWAAGTAGYLGAGIRLRSIHLRIAGVVAVVVAGILAAVGYAESAPAGYVVCFNWRFIAGMAVAIAVFAYAHVLRRLREICEPDEQKVSTTFYGTGILLLTVLMSVETWLWLDERGLRYLARCLLPMIWAAGTAGYLVTGMRLRSIHIRLAGIGVLVAAGILAAVGYAHGAPAGCLIYFNWRFAGGLAVALAVFGYAYLLRRRQDICEPDERSVSTAFYGIGIFLLVILMSAETWLWLDIYNHHYLSRCLLPLIWVAGTAAYLYAGTRLRSVHLRLTGIGVLTVAGILAGVGYAHRLDGYVMFFNGRFAAALAAALMVLAYGFALRRLREISSPDEQKLSDALYGMGIFALIILTSVETWLWLDARGLNYLARCLLPLIWAAGAAGYLGTGVRLRSAGMRSLGLLILAVAGILAARGYAFEMDSGYLLYLNGRFLAALAVVAMIFTHGAVLRRFRELCEPAEKNTARTLYGIGFAVPLVLLSVETYLYFIRTIADPEAAKWAAQMSLSIVWGVYAATMLALGFWRNWRPLRLSALGLFGLTALKLVLIDMAKVKEAYRITSFLVLGALMIGASYLYHRVEKWLEATAGEKGDGGEGKGAEHD